MGELSNKALNRNPEINPLVALKMDYTVAGNNMIILVGTATAVKFEPIH